MGAAAGFAAFFAATFLGIVTILMAEHRGAPELDFALSYRRVGLPVGLVVLATAWSYLGTLWLRRQLRRG